MTTKKQTERRHARRRAEERYGLRLDRRTRRQIRDAVHARHSRLVRSESRRTRVYDVPVDGRTVRIVWDRHRQEIVTFLPRNEA